MLAPNPAVIEVIIHRVDPITSAPYDTTSVRYGADVELQTGENGLMLVWDEGDELRGVVISEPVDEGGGVLTATAVFSDPAAPDETIRIRPLDPYDAITLAPDAGVPQPLTVVEAHILRGGMLALQLDAVVAPDNTVVTLIIETGMGPFVRYDGEWIALPEGNTTLDDMSLVQVAPSALAVWDAGDASGKTISVADLPTKLFGGEAEIIQMPGEDQPAVGEPEEAVVAAGANIPSVNRVDDLPVAVRYAITHPDSRWYVVKRAKALGALDKIPQEWQLGKAAPETLPEFPASDSEEMTLPFEEATAASAVVAVAKHYVQLCINGDEPVGVFGSLMMQSREHRLLGHPAIIAAINWREWLHPRGKDGTFIEKFGLVNVFADKNAPITSRTADRRRGQITNLTPQGVHVAYVDQDGNAIPADPAAGFPDVIPVGDINDKVMMAPKSLATLPRSLTENLSAIEEVDVARAADPNYREPISLDQYEQKLQAFIASRPPAPNVNVKGQPPLTDEEYQAHVKWLDDTLAEARAAGLAYEDAFRDSNGQWSTEREEYFEQLVDELHAEMTVTKDGKPKPQGRKSLLLGGLPGAGKSTILSEAVGGEEILDRDWVQINSDLFKERIAERGDAPDIPGMGELETADLIHKMSSRLAMLFESRLIAEGYNVIFDGTMGGDPPPVNVDDLRQLGYAVDGVFVDVPIDVSLKRVQERHRRGIDRLRDANSDDTIGGRYVPSRVIEKNRVRDTTQNIINFNDLSEYMDRWAAYDNTTKPATLLDHSAEMPGAGAIGVPPVAPAAPAGAVAAAAGVFGTASGTDHVVAMLYAFKAGLKTFDDVREAVANATFAVRKTEPTMDNHAALYEAFNSVDQTTFEDTVVRAKYQRILTNDQVAQLQREAHWEAAS